jgi:purine-binding chemotaxis protein CheW
MKRCKRADSITGMGNNGRTRTASGRCTESDTRQFVTFIAGNEVFAVDMAPVQEIIRVPERACGYRWRRRRSTALSNLRGKVLPIISLRRIFGFSEQEHDDSTRALVIDFGQPLGFVVDRVASVVGVEQPGSRA